MIERTDKEEIIEKYLKGGMSDYALAKALGISLLSDARTEVDHYLQKKKINQALDATSNLRDTTPVVCNFAARLLEHGLAKGDGIDIFEQCFSQLVEQSRLINVLQDGLRAAWIIAEQ